MAQVVEHIFKALSSTPGKGKKRFVEEITWCDWKQEQTKTAKLTL
jgi:hypothetical protein